MDPKDIVRTGYDTLSYLYRKDDDSPVNLTRWAHLLVETLRPVREARVLELGCRCDIPVARTLAGAGLHLVGVDISTVQIKRAKELIPEGQFFRADITDIVRDSAEGELQDIILNNAPFDAVVAFHVLIHIPVGEQVALFRHLGNWAQLGGYCMMTVGVTSWTGEVKGWMGSDQETRMWWSQASLNNYREWAEDGGFEIIREAHAEGGSEGHQFLLLKRSM